MISHPSLEELVKTFNTALITSRSKDVGSFSSDVMLTVENPAFKAILEAVRLHSISQNISEKQAAEQIVQTFRKIDQLWQDYVFQEGLDRIRSQ